MEMPHAAPLELASTLLEQIRNSKAIYKPKQKPETPSLFTESRLAPGRDTQGVFGPRETKEANDDPSTHGN